MTDGPSSSGDRSHLAGHPQILDMVVQGKALDEILGTVCALVERELPGCCASVLLFNEDRLHLRVAAAPSMPPSYALIDNVAVGSGVGTAGTAAYEDRDVITIDTATDPAWSQWRAEAAERRLVSCWAAPFHGAQQQVLGTVAVYFAQRRELAGGDLDLLHDAGSLVAIAVQHDSVRRTLRDSSRTHPLTGIPNRVALVERLRVAVTRAVETGGNFGVVMISVDGLSPINESLGASAGDAVLRGVAQRLTSLVGSAGTVAHVWGSDFVLLADELPSGPDADQRVLDLAERARDVVTEPLDVDGMTLTVDVSMGVSAYGSEVQASSRPDDEPLRAANVALEHARSAGGQRIGVYDPNSDPRADVRLLVPELRRGLADEQLTLAYQPIVALGAADGEQVVRYEALLRWHGPRGVVSPDSFVPVAEQTGLVVDLGRYALQRALAELARQRDAGRDIGLSVNLSARQLMDDSLPDTVAELLAQHAVPHGALTLEVTEGVLLRSDSKGWHALHRVAESGVRVSLDDFGTGYSQISYLRRYPFDEIKVGQDLVQAMVSDVTARAITVGTIAFAVEAGIPFVAEGVETLEQADQLRELGATHAQGFLFGQPRPTAGEPRG